MSAISVGTRPVVGNAWALAGTVVYFLEWVAIAAAGGINTFLATDSPTSTLLKSYRGHEDTYGWAAGWFGVVLLGRIVFAVAVRRSLTASPDTRDDVRILADVGVLAMAVGLVLELASNAMFAAGASLGDHGASTSTLRTVDVIGRDLNLLLWGPTGLSVLCFAVAMLLDRRFPRALPWVGVVGGGVLVVEALVFEAPRFTFAASALQTVALLFWVWMIWTAVWLFRRRTPARTAEASARHP